MFVYDLPTRVLCRELEFNGKIRNSFSYVTLETNSIVFQYSKYMNLSREKTFVKTQKYRQTSSRMCPEFQKPKCFSSHLVVVFAQSIEARF